MSELIYLDGKFVPKEKAMVNVFDHGLLYGDGIFEGIRIYESVVFKLDDHIDRLWDSAKAIHLTIPMSKEEMCEVVLESCRQNKIVNGYIRLVVTRGVGDLGLNPYLCKKATVFCIAANIQLYPAELYETGMKIVTVPTTRNFVDALNPRIKSLNYLNNILAKIEALQSGVPEALMLNTQGFVAECTGDNVFLVKKGKIITPNVASGALEGITRNAVIELARKKGYEVSEEFVTRFDVYTADEMFLTGTAAECIPVVQVDQRDIGEGNVGPITKELIEDFRSVVSKDGRSL